jgi:hypothetical protein
MEEPSIGIRHDGVIDIWTQRSEEALVAEKTRVRYFDIAHNALHKLIDAIKHPVEMRLLPHIVREWRRQSLPISLTNAQKIARFATLHDEVDVVLQMIRPEVYGLYYDMKGLREITRGLAKRAALLQHREGQKELVPEDMLHWVPELLHCSVGTDANRLLQDPAVLGTLLWGFIARFNNDETFRTSKSVMEMCGMAERVLASLNNKKSGSPLFLDETIPKNRRREFVFTIKYQVLDYIPVLYALRQFVEIILAPYRACLKALQNADMPDKNAQQSIIDLRQCLSSRISIPQSSAQNIGYDAAKRIRDGNKLKWISLNRRLGSEIKRNRVHLPALSSWQWSVLKRFTVPSTSPKTPEGIVRSSSDWLYLPLRTQATLEALEKCMEKWDNILETEGIPTQSEFKIITVKYGLKG